MTELDARRQRLLAEMGITVWRRQGAPAGTAGPVTPAAPTGQTETPSQDDAWAALKQKIMDCQACVLHQTRIQAVPGVGDRQPRLLVVGEAPGEQEDRRGEPFVGRSGQLLDAMLAAIGLDRRNGVFITNAVKSRPPDNRNPRRGEIDACQPWLEAQIRLLQPKCILAVGKISAQVLTGTREALGPLRGRWHAWGEAAIPVRVTYHPAYLLRTPTEKAAAWEDLLTVQRVLRERAA